MTGYGQFCSMARAHEVLGGRWTLLIVREILCGSRRFNDIRRGIPRVSRTVLSERLQALVFAGAIAREVIAGRNWRNLKVVGFVLALALVNLAFHVEDARLGLASFSIRTALAICENKVIRLGDLPAEITQPGRQSAAASEPDISLEHAEREALLRVIEKNDWVMSHVATQLGISRNTLYRKIKRHGIPLTRN